MDHQSVKKNHRWITNRSKRIAKQRPSDHEKIHMLTRFSAIN
jgi:hypothetical protein